MFSLLPKYTFTMSKAANLDSIKIFIKELKDVSQLAPIKLDQQEIKLSFLVHSIDKDWKITSKSLTRELQFESFKQAFVFMNTVSGMADQMNHYPKWINVYNKIQIEITTPDTNGVSIKDVILAFIMDSVIRDVKQQNVEHISETSKVIPGVLLQNWNADYSKPEYVEIIKKNIHSL